MKKLTIISLISALSLAMAACGNENADEKPNTQNVKEQAAAMEKEAEAKHEGHDHNDHMAEATAPVVSTDSGIGIIDPHVRPTHPGQKVSAAYFTITNPTDKDIEVTGVSSSVSNITEMHTMEMQDSKMVMRKLDEVVIPAGGKFVMNQGGNHVMLIELHKPLAVDDDVTVNLELSNGEKLEVSTKVAEMPEGTTEMDHSNHEGHDLEHKHEDHNHDEKKSDSH